MGSQREILIPVQRIKNQPTDGVRRMMGRVAPRIAPLLESASTIRLTGWIGGKQLSSKWKDQIRWQSEEVLHNIYTTLCPLFAEYEISHVGPVGFGFVLFEGGFFFFFRRGGHRRGRVLLSWVSWVAQKLKS